MKRIAAYNGPVPGADSNTYEIWDSTQDSIGVPGSYFVLRPRFTQPGVLIAEYKSRAGLWVEFYRTHALPAPDNVSHYFNINVAPFWDIRVRWQNGGVAQAAPFDMMAYFAEEEHKEVSRFSTYLAAAALNANILGPAIPMCGRKNLRARLSIPSVSGVPNGVWSLQGHHEGEWDDIGGAAGQFQTAGNLFAGTRYCVWYGLDFDYTRLKYTASGGGGGNTVAASVRVTP